MNLKRIVFVLIVLALLTGLGAQEDARRPGTGALPA